jgi:exodeoxyribonuclease V alpha subunit
MADSLTPHQSEQLAVAVSSRVGILTGAAGTGKSFTVARYLESINGGYLVAAPTGKAASRLNAELSCGARTIHAMLEPLRNGHDGDGWGFNRNESLPLQCSTLIIDEAFMLSTSLTASLLRAVKPGTQVLFTGDPNQLPPVGHGRPVYDMLQSGVIPHGHLTEIHRFAGRIARVANAIKDGKTWQPSKSIDLDSKPPENLRHIEVNIPQTVKVTLSTVIEKMAGRFDPINDVQVICALNDKGILSRHELNPYLQNILNPNGLAEQSCPYKTGDKIICTRNHFRGTLDTSRFKTDEQIYIANGEIGRVIDFRKSANNKVTGIFAMFCGELVLIEKGWFPVFDLAYAITCHRFQGAQSPVVIAIIDDSADRVASRQWWYTAVTRGAQLVITIGRMQTIIRQCRRVDLMARKTFLKERIQEFGRSQTFNFDDELALI